jgi:hypothetical protein
MSKQAATTKKSQSARHNPDDQIKGFRKAARELGCDESEDRFKVALRTVGKAKPQQQPKRQHKGR